eukprot:Plantae.Rhodophyta-Rhodochaete_pulchella.ctg76409.p1 GENE.Plantae.Rhodophyta-Rhodochaete_pulchella.ctg76409~~Plantae.Rhodophyta-Rhodochaete_pulchella.ctg76409.p1  ORF type:complete len:143 (-),score=26.50 Plantae.Rhodophyta-Rhodochaete_pulchella.ctg76409:118-546(-)
MAFVSVGGLNVKHNGRAMTCARRIGVVKMEESSELVKAELEAASANSAFVTFRSLMAAERNAALSDIVTNRKLRMEIWESGVSENTLLTFQGQLDHEGARLQKMKTYPMFSPSGERQTQIPGMPGLDSVGAMDYMDTKQIVY